MLEKFSGRARDVVVQASESAMSLGHDSIGTEHLLLGLIAERSGIAARVLEQFGITRERTTDEVVRLRPRGIAAESGAVPFDADAKRTLELSLEEANALGGGRIETEHMLLALVRQPESMAGRILTGMKVTAGDVRLELIRRSYERAARLAEVHRPGFGTWGEVGPTGPLRQVLVAAAQLAIDCGRSQIDVADVLLTIVAGRHELDLIAQLGIDEAAVAQAVSEHLARRTPPEHRAEN